MNHMPQLPFARDNGILKAFAMLKAVTQIGMPREITTVLLDMTLEAHQLEKLSSDVRRFVSGPVVVDNSNGWGPDWDGHPVHRFKDLIAAERMEIAMGTSPYLVGPVEIMCVMHAATMAAPLQTYISELYLWASAKAIIRRSPEQRLTMKQVYAMVSVGDGSGLRDLTDKQVLNDEPWRHHYHAICSEIRRKVIAVQTKRESAARKG